MNIQFFNDHSHQDNFLANEIIDKTLEREKMSFDIESDNIANVISENGVSIHIANENSNDNDIIDEFNEMILECDIIPPPLDFANDAMLPLRKSKSAPAPFKKLHQGAIL